MNEPMQEQTLIEHLTELRVRLVWIIGILLVGFLVCYGFSEWIFKVIRAPIQPYLKSPSGGLVFTAPMDNFLAHMKVSALAGIVLTCPLWIYQVWRFVAPGLYKSERKWALMFVGFGSLMFIIGVSFVYFVVFPLAFKFLLNFGGGVDTPMITVGDYLSFFFTTTLMFGAAFELPLVMVILAMLGIVDHTLLITYRRHAIVLMGVISAVLTPPDILSMVLMLIPLMILYEISVVLVRMIATGRWKTS